MRTGLLSAAAACASLFLASGCGKVESCTEGDMGCLNGPAASGKCSFGLVADESGICAKKGTTSTPLADSCGGCASGDVCQRSGSCVDICEVPSNWVQSGPSLPACAPAAGQAAFDYPTVAVAYCKQECAHRAAYCGGTCNPDKDCTPAAAMLLLAVRCPGQAVACATMACVEARDTPCAQQKCANNMAPVCTGVACSNSCTSGSTSFNLDGICDDGDLSNAVSAICGWGTDCGDCGPRKGTPPPAIKDLGEQCIDPYQCGASDTDFSHAPGWCVPVSTNSQTTEEVQRCVPDCTVSQRCPDGFQCRELVFDPDGSGPKTEQSLKDNAGLVGKACFRTTCGG